jgi:hypothetical protein
MTEDKKIARRFLILDLEESTSGKRVKKVFKDIKKERKR